MKVKFVSALTLAVVAGSVSLPNVATPVRADPYDPYARSSNFWDRQIASRNAMAAVVNRGLQNQRMMQGTSSGAQQKQRGQAVIKSGRATTRFAMRPFPLQKWLKIWAAATRNAKSKLGTSGKSRARCGVRKSRRVTRSGAIWPI